METASIEESMFGVALGVFPGRRCAACGETFLDAGAMDELEQRARKAGIWGLGKKAKVVKSGNSLVIRIPADLARHLKLRAGSEVFVHPEGEARIVVDVE